MHVSRLISNFTNVITTVVSHYSVNEIAKCLVSIKKQKEAMMLQTLFLNEVNRIKVIEE